MPPCDRAVDSISPAFDKHDFAGGKVDRSNLSTRERHPSATISILQGPRKFRPLRSSQTMPVQDLGHDFRSEFLKVAHRVRNVTKMLDNSGRKLFEERQGLAADPRAQETRIFVGRIVCVRDAMAFEMRDDVG